MHRAYHLSRVPTFNRKARVLAEWTLSGLFKREIVSLGSLEHPAPNSNSPPPRHPATTTSRRPDITVSAHVHTGRVTIVDSHLHSVTLHGTDTTRHTDP